MEDSNHKARFTLWHIQRASLILMLGTGAANLVSFVKSILIARYYGTSAELDAYFLSLAPLRLVVGVLIGAVQGALIPAYLDLSVKKDEPYAFAFFGTFAVWLMGFLGILSILFWAGSPVLATYLGSGFDVKQQHFTAALLQLSTGLFILNVASELGGCLFKAHRKFAFFALVPLISGVGAVGYLLCFHAQGVVALMYGLLFGMVCQNVVILYGARRFVPEQIAWFHAMHDDLKNTFKTMAPLLLGASFGHVNVIVDQMMASRLPAGSIAALNYANKLHTVLTQMFIMVISSVVLPFFAKQAAEHDIDALKATFRLTIKRIAAILTPISIGIILFGEPLVRIAFQRGAFSTESTTATAGAWIAYTLGLPVMAIGILTARIYNVLQANTILMYVAAGNIGANILFNWLFMKVWGHIGIALSTSVVYVIATGILLFLLPRKIGPLW